MTIKVKLILVPALILAFAACRKIIEPKDLPQQDPMIVLNGILRTDSSIKVNVSASRSILSGKDYKYINNAVCAVYEDGNYVQNLKFVKDGNYTGSLIPKPNRTYTFKVGATGYKDVDAVTTIPYNVDTGSIKKYRTTSYSREIFNGSDAYRIRGGTKLKLSIKDNRSIKNYYSLTAAVNLFDSLGTLLNYSVSPRIVLTLDNKYFFGPVIDVDENYGSGGIEIPLEVELNVDFMEQEDMPLVKSIQVFLQIHNFNEDYYKYRETVFNQTNLNTSLFAEPVQVYSNIKNGIGILAGDNITNIMVYSGEIVEE